MCNKSNCCCSEDFTSIDYQLSILQAAKEGKTIEISERVPRGQWSIQKFDTPRFDFIHYCYRVKKEPRKFNVLIKGTRISRYNPRHDLAVLHLQGWELIEVVEVVK